MLKLHYLYKCDTNFTAVAVVLREKKHDSSKSDGQGGECKAVGGRGGGRVDKENGCSSFYDIVLL